MPENSIIRAVVYGGVKNKTAHISETSLTLNSGEVAALVGGSKVNPDHEDLDDGDIGSVGTATITITGGTVCGDTGCSDQPYADKGMVMAAWYWGPDVDTFVFNMTGGEVTGNVYGGGVTANKLETEFTVDSFVADISGGKITGVLYGGGHANSEKSDTSIRHTQTTESVEITVSGGLITFSTKGYGHGVGLSQRGALGYSAAGWGYHQIFTHYYKGVTIRTM